MKRISLLKLTLLACSLAYPAFSAPINYTYTPILLIHGSGLDSRTWTELIDWFEKRGYPDTYIEAVDIVPNNESNITAAHKFIRPAVKRLLQRANRQARNSGFNGIKHTKFDIVAHSMGAVSGRWYATVIAPEKVRRFVSIAGANHGTSSLCGMAGKGNIEMCPAFAVSRVISEVQYKLNHNPEFNFDETPYGTGFDEMPGKRYLPPDMNRRITYFTIRIEPDEWIKPENSAILNGAGLPGMEAGLTDLFIETSMGNYRYINKVSHDNLPKDETVIEFVFNLLIGN